MRRSSRESRKPEFLTFSARGLSLSQSQEEQKESQEGGREEEEEEQEEGQEEEQEEDDEEEGDAEDELPVKKTKPQNKSSKKNINSSSISSKKKKNNESSNSNSKTPKANNGNKLSSKGNISVSDSPSPSTPPPLSASASLFQQVSTLTKFDEVADAWIERYLMDRISAISELVNFSLFAAGAREDCVQSDIDLDALDQEEIEQLLSAHIKRMTQTEGSKVYPLIAKGKGKWTFRYRYQQFWQATVLRVMHRANSKVASKSLLKVEVVVRRIVEQLSNLSTMAVVNIRDAVMEAVLSIADAMSQVCIDLKGQRDVAERHLQSESIGKQKKTDMNNPKNKAFAKQKDDAQKMLGLLSSIVSSIFTSVFIHRSKDFNDEIRWNCLRHINSFLLFDITMPIKSEYLKYLGWSLYDPNRNIRLEAAIIIDNLVNRDDLTVHLQNFIEHFMERFVFMAAADVDAEVSVHMIDALRSMQKQGFLDAISEEQLEVVDMVVFDPDASSEMRVAALLFLMDHTQGFEDFDEDSFLQQQQSSAKSRKRDSSNIVEEARRKNVALQLETLTEFAEHHLRDRTEGSALLAEACLATHKAELLYDWSTIIALLTRENEDLITSALRPTQVAVLLRMFATAAKAVSMQVSRADESKLSKKAQQELLTARDNFENLNIQLQTKLTLLLTRFKDDSLNLSVLSELFRCCDVGSGSKSFSTLLKSLKDLALSPHQSVALLRNIFETLKMWLTQNYLADSVSQTLSQIIQYIWSKILETATNINDEFKKVNKSQKSRRASVDVRYLNDLTKTLSSAMRQFKIAWETMDCRPFLEQKDQLYINSMVDDTIEIAEVVSTLNSSAVGANISVHLIDITSAVLGIVKTIMLWTYRDLIVLGRELKLTKFDTLLEAEELVHEQMQMIINIRNKLLDTARTFMVADESSNSNVSRQASIEGFRIMSDIRTLFPIRGTDYEYIDQLSFQASPEDLKALKSVFESESSRICEEMESVEKEGSKGYTKVVDSLAADLVQKLLFPLSGSLVFDVDNLNRKQFAAVIKYLFDPHEKVQDAVKSVARLLKEKDFYKFLQVQLIVLKDLFQDLVLSHALERTQADANDDTEFDFVESERAEKDGIDRLQSASKKLSSLIGVGKLKGAAEQALKDFMYSAVGHSFSSVHHLRFLVPITIYLRFFGAVELRALDLHVQARIEELPILSEFPIEAAMVEDFISHVTGNAKPRNAKRQSINNSSLGRSLKGSKAIQPIRDTDVVDVSLSQIVGTVKSNKVKGRIGSGVKEVPVAVKTSQRRSSRSKTAISYVEDLDASESEDVKSPTIKQAQVGYATGLDIDDSSDDGKVTRSSNPVASSASSVASQKKRGLELKPASSARESSSRRRLN